MQIHKLYSCNFQSKPMNSRVQVKSQRIEDYNRCIWRRKQMSGKDAAITGEGGRNRWARKKTRVRPGGLLFFSYFNKFQSTINLVNTF